jgi:adenylate kinase family enzyme
LRRVEVIGPSCSGKTTTARRLAEILGVPYIELDALHHDLGWQEAPAEVLRTRVEAALAAAPDGWVVDGNYFGKLGPCVLDRADTIVWLDVPYGIAVRRVLSRTVRRSLSREELWNGNRESFRLALSRDSIIWWVVRNHRRFAPKWVSRLEGRNVVRVTDADAWLQSRRRASDRGRPRRSRPRSREGGRRPPRATSRRRRSRA